MAAIASQNFAEAGAATAAVETGASRGAAVTATTLPYGPLSAGAGAYRDQVQESTPSDHRPHHHQQQQQSPRKKVSDSSSYTAAGQSTRHCVNTPARSSAARVARSLSGGRSLCIGALVNSTQARFFVVACSSAVTSNSAEMRKRSRV